ncbi:hypothetical protein A3K73_03235 [Candidatus Pacearchaeota archaeon RBG_13_36_9]|nr:MAG: hypothetical protein A3K73_03235 [Candidatus Pacearchaeota archaeon RBG_13_36_9]
MIKENEEKILGILKEDDLVLDIGGWDKPFNRANYVLDIHPYKTRGFHGTQGGDKEYFNKKTWVIHDLSSKKKFPFKDKQFDFVICSHVLEDIRDPIWLCSELIRISKRGYIEFPSVYSELTKGYDNNNYTGYYHHRWLIEIKNKKIIFRFKPHFIHGDKRYYLPRTYLRKLSEKEINSFLFWKDNFYFAEVIQISRDKLKRHINELIKSKGYRKNITFLLDSLDKIRLNYKKFKKIFIKNSYCPRYMGTREFYSTV